MMTTAAVNSSTTNGLKAMTFQFRTSLFAVVTTPALSTEHESAARYRPRLAKQIREPQVRDMSAKAGTDKEEQEQ